MADVEAPLARIEKDDWEDINDFRFLTSLTNGDGVDNVCLNVSSSDDGLTDQQLLLQSLPLLDNGCSLGDNISRCFRNDTRQLEEIPPAEVQSQNDFISDSKIWNQISESYDNVLPVDWSRSYARQLQENSLNLKQKTSESEVCDLSDDEELKQSMDLHSLILCSNGDEPLKTADEVISEIEEMMEDDSDTSECVSMDGPSKTAQLIRTKLKQAVPPGSTMKDCLQKMEACDLETLHDELDCTIREYSEVLVHDLEARSELSFQKELNNQFISLILSIQRKRRDLELDRKKTGGKMPQAKLKEYLTTVIPYDHHQGPPDADRLQIYVKILSAIDEDNPTVPLLLTDYILNVLCPKT